MEQPEPGAVNLFIVAAEESRKVLRKQGFFFFFCGFVCLLWYLSMALEMSILSPFLTVAKGFLTNALDLIRDSYSDILLQFFSLPQVCIWAKRWELMCGNPLLVSLGNFLIGAKCREAGYLIYSVFKKITYSPPFPMVQGSLQYITEASNGNGTLHSTPV